MPSLGYGCLVLALAVSLYTAAAFWLEARGRQFPAIFRARTALLVAVGLVSVSVAVLLYAIFAHDFQFEYVASYTSLHTSALYLLSALWAGNSGSLLFWTWLLSIFSLLVVWRKQGRYPALLPYVASIMLAVQAFFLILLVAVINPFNAASPVPSDGIGLNPMLQNPGMVFHPPALYAGYVGFTVPFAFAIAALLTRRLNDEWLQASRRWMLFAWLLLGVGNIIGAWWAYVELGWGGYWAWDPVENVGLMPWLLATALLHSSVMQRRKSTFKVWNLVLIILVFNMVIFGTFLTRSSILSSVHTFNESGLEPYFLTFIAVSLIGGLGLLYYRSSDLKSSGGSEALISRDAAFMLNNLIFLGTTALIFIGTLFPLFSEAAGGSKVSLSTSFFNQVDSPLFMVIILLAGVCTLIGWRQLTLRQLLKELIWPLTAAVILGVVLGLTAVKQPLALVAFSVCIFVLVSILSSWFKETLAHRRSSGNNVAVAGWNLARSNSQRLGGYTVHTGIILIAVGVIGSSFFGTQKEANLKVGDSITVGQYAVTYNGLSTQDTPDKTIFKADLTVTDQGRPFTSLVAQKYYQKAQQQNVTEVALHSNLFEDVYVILEDWQNNGATADFKVLVNPLVIWIWIGGGVFLLGGLAAFWPTRRSRSRSPADETVKASLVAPPAGAPAAQSAAAPPVAGAREAEDEIERQVLKLRQSTGQYCPQCGQKNRKEARFCTRCGTRLPKGKRDE